MWRAFRRAGLGLACVALAGITEAKAAPFQIYGGMDDGAGAVSEAQRVRPVPEELKRRTIAFATDLPPGSIVVKTGARRLYFVLPGGRAIEYRVGVGREGYAWTGRNAITAKARWPDWRPPPEMIAREKKRGRTLAAFVPGGPENTLGARALYIGDTMFRIHGTSEAWSVGEAVSSGCIRMLNAEVVDLYERVAVGAAVVVEE